MKPYSVIVPVFQTEENAERLIEELYKQSDIFLDQVIVIADKTEIECAQDKTLVVHNEERVGKSRAVNIGLSLSKTEINILVSSDVFISQEGIKHIVKELDRGYEIVSPKIVTSENRGLPSKLYKVIWSLHSEVSKRSLKPGEVVGFKGDPQLPEETVADEEYISSIKKKKSYLEDAVAENKPPETLKELYKQRRRVFIGHILLMKRNQHIAPSNNILTLLKALKSTISEEENIGLVILTILLEFMARADGAARAILLGEKPYKWEKIRTA